MRLPEGWKLVPIKEICSCIVDCVNKTAAIVDYETPYKMIRTTNVRHGRVDTKNVRYVTKETYKIWTRRGNLENGDLIFTREAPVGEIGILEDASGVFLGQRTIMYRAHPLKSNNLFILYSLQSLYCKKQIEDFSNGGTVAHVRVPDCSEIILKTPPLPEQQKIAKILSTWDKAIKKLEALIAAKQKRKKALMQQLLTGKKRFAGFEGEWKRVHIRDCAVCMDNKRVPLNSDERAMMAGNIPYWGANGIVDYIDKYIFDETIVLLAEDGGYFDEYSTRPIANISHGKAWVNNHAHILRAKNNSTNKWIYYSLVHKNILAFVNGGTRAKLNKSDMLQIPIFLPPILEQQKITSVLSAADTEIQTHQNQLSALKEQKKGLMQQLLTGKKRVKVDDHV